MPIENISDTALWVAAFRARESERPDAIIRDPYARRLAGERGEALARSMRGASAMAPAMAVRTRVLDDLILAYVERHGVDMVINLAAGLDTRPHRMPLPAGLRWVEVDLPPLLAYKEALLGPEPHRCALERVALDLADADARRALFARLGADSKRSLVVTEGLLPYLTENQVAGLARDMHEVPAFAYWLMDIYQPHVLSHMQAMYGTRLAEGNASFQFGPAAGSEFFRPLGWHERLFSSALEDGQALKREMPLSWLWQLGRPFVPASRRELYRRMAGILLLERTGP